MKQSVIVSGFLVLFFSAVYSAPVKAEGTVQLSASIQQLDDKLSRKLDSIERKQDEILRRLEEVKTELNIVKIRASLSAK